MTKFFISTCIVCQVVCYSSLFPVLVIVLNLDSVVIRAILGYKIVNNILLLLIIIVKHLPMIIVVSYLMPQVASRDPYNIFELYVSSYFANPSFYVMVTGCWTYVSSSLGSDHQYFNP